MAKKIVETPLMKQYAEMKRRHPDAILLFRVGDFYETFSDDAIAASDILGITLTRRANGAAAYVELAGFPHHALDSYLPRLVRAGRRVAICEQLEDPKKAKGLVKRGITELVTPGVTLNDGVLQARQNNFLCAMHAQAKSQEVGVAFLDVSTGEFFCTQGPQDYVDKLLAAFAPKEVLIERGLRRQTEEKYQGRFLTFELDDWVFTLQAATQRLLTQFGTTSLKGYGIDKMPLAVIAAGAALAYLDITEHKQTAHINAISRLDPTANMRLDPFTIRNLELVEPLSPEGTSLLQVIDRTHTPMGARRLHSWLLMPLLDPEKIACRQRAVKHLVNNPDMASDVAQQLQRIGDLQRLTSKIASLRITPREVMQVRTALEAMVPLAQACLGADCPDLAAIARAINPCTDLAARIARELNPDPTARPGSGHVIAQGVNTTLDSLRQMAHSGKEYLEAMRHRESESTGISSLKIAYNNVFGYYIEVTNTHRDKVPQTWVRRQTLANAERYITPELKDYEEKILTAQSRIESLEISLFNDLVAALAHHLRELQGNSDAVATLDCLLSMALVAVANNYTCPVVDDSLALTITKGRHPVIEQRLPIGQPYIANTVALDNEQCQIMMITGPNMSGKSALLRQTALNVILAQTGSFVAAQSARIGVVDKVFTRVGASDNISSGESTFMVEMAEAASILNNMSQRSLILFDELGRGTSTYDGISIARAIVEYIHQSPGLQPKTLFATHYHELNEMANDYERIRNFHVSVREIDGRVVFVRTLEPGGSEHSFGIHVARLAGMPRKIVERADKILAQLESLRHRAQGHDAAKTAAPIAPDMKGVQALGGGGTQLSFFQLDDPVLSQVRDEILGLDINNLTPMEALNKLNDIRIIITGK